MDENKNSYAVSGAGVIAPSTMPTVFELLIFIVIFALPAGKWVYDLR